MSEIQVVFTQSLNHYKLNQWQNRWREQLELAYQNDRYSHLNQIEFASDKKLKKAVKFIHYIYNIKKNPILAFNFYINFIQKYAKSLDLKRIEVWQLQDMLLAILNQEVVWLRTRRGGKTRDLTLVSTFWALVGKLGMWFAPSSDQLQQANIYFLANPFFSHKSDDNYYFSYTEQYLELKNLTLSKSASKGKDFIIYDEGAKIQKGLLIFDYYKFSRVIIAGKLWEGDKHILSASTASRNSAIEEEYNLMMNLDPEMVSIHAWTDCWWISEKWIKQEEMANLQDPWFVDQEYRTLFVNRGGSVFDNIKQMKVDDMPNLITHIGEDINKNEAVVYLHISSDKKNIYILGEEVLDWTKNNNCYNHIKPSSVHMLKTKQVKFAHNYSFEIEAMGYNEKEALWICQNIPRASANKEWGDDMKGERVAIAKMCTIWVDPIQTPNVYQDLQNTVYHPYQGCYLKDRAHHNHWLEAFLHGVGAQGGQLITVDSYKEKIQNELPRHLQKNKITHRA